MSFYNSMVIFEKENAKDRYEMNISKDKTKVTSSKEFFKMIR
jgi:hypothetical protein